MAKTVIYRQGQPASTCGWVVMCKGALQNADAVHRFATAVAFLARKMQCSSFRALSADAMRSDGRIKTGAYSPASPF